MGFDYQTVRLISITKPVSDEFTDESSSEDLISYCARVSNPSNQKNFDSSSKLLRYCIDNKHWSIFEMVDITMEIRTTRDIGRQILRHRTANFQEFSQRYAEVSDDLVFRECRLQDMKNRQSSLETSNQMLEANWLAAQIKVAEEAEKQYKWAIQSGIAKEVARVVLPEGMTMSRMYMKNNLRNWIHYCDLRRGNGTQKEHQDIANKCWTILQENFSFLKDWDNGN